MYFYRSLAILHTKIEAFKLEYQTKPVAVVNIKRLYIHSPIRDSRTLKYFNGKDGSYSLFPHTYNLTIDERHI